MDSVALDENFTPSYDFAAIIAQANRELAYERFRKAVDEKKIELLTYKPLWQKLFPFKVTVERL